MGGLCVQSWRRKEGTRGREKEEIRGKKVLYVRRKEESEERKKSLVLYKKGSCSPVPGALVKEFKSRTIVLEI